MELPVSFLCALEECVCVCLCVCLCVWVVGDLIVLLHHVGLLWLDEGAAATGGGWFLQIILCAAATATQLELLSALILGLHVMWKTPWAVSTSSSDDRGFTCQLVFIILLRFVVYSTEFNLSYVKYFPILQFVLLFQIRISRKHSLASVLDSTLNTFWSTRRVTPKVKVAALKKMT